MASGTRKNLTRGLSVPWSGSDRPVARLLVKPLQQFLALEAASGVLLLIAAIVALVWANSPWSASYDKLWHTELTISIGSYSISEDLQHWINDALMALFFFVVGLEIKRELVSGELRDPRAAALPAIAALGGMIVPAALFAVFNAGGPGSSGWGVPMATDIAFAVGIFSLAGRGVPTQVKLFLLALAIVDDIGAIAVIAIFYSGGVSWVPLGIAVATLVLIALIQRIGVRSLGVYVPLGVVTWLAVYESGVHATIAGVALGLLTPAWPFHRPAAASAEAKAIADATSDEPDPSDEDTEEWLALARVSREAVPPVARLERTLHPWTSFVIVPIFALANAGVNLGGGAFGDALTSPVTLGIVAGLVVGKTLGISFATWIAVKTKISRLPEGVTWPQIVATSAIAGIGFTVALFIAGLAYKDPTFAPELLAESKVGILVGSLVAGTFGAALLALSRRRTPAR